MADPAAHTRRAFLRSCGAAAGALACGSLPLRADAQLAAPFLPPYRVDVNGNGQIGPVDLQLVRRATGGRRGFAIEPAPGYDFRADIFGRGIVDSRDLQAVEDNAPLFAGLGRYPEHRPVTVAWHYGWHNERTRAPTQTVKFLGGDYVSRDPAIEATFNRLKNECGVTVDALSWFGRRADARVEASYRSGYLRADGVATRHVALLYESLINLPGSKAERKNFERTDTRGRLVSDFAAMGRFLAHARDESPVRIFRLDGRPVLFLYGSHAWGVGAPLSFEFMAMDQAIEDAREAFRRSFGAYPYLVGEEELFALSDVFGLDRIQRAANFDAVFSYHHASSQQQVRAANGRMSASYRRVAQELRQRNYEVMRLQLNRFTLNRILVVPSLAAGFAKRGFRKLVATKREYADFLEAMVGYHESNYLLPEWGSVLGTGALPAPVYTVGSWNEEYEGHAIFPATFNRALRERRVGGFDFFMALRQVFSWNHYAQRPIFRPPRQPTPFSD